MQPMSGPNINMVPKTPNKTNIGSELSCGPFPPLYLLARSAIFAVLVTVAVISAAVVVEVVMVVVAVAVTKTVCVTMIRRSLGGIEGIAAANTPAAGVGVKAVFVLTGA